MTSRHRSGRPAVTIRPDRDTLAALYVDGQMSAPTIGERYGVSTVSVAKWLRYHGIPVRKAAPEPPREVLFDLYVTQGMTSRQMARHLKVCRNRVLEWVDRAGFEKHRVPSSLGAKGIDVPTKEQLHELVHVRHKTLREIGAMFGGASNVAVRWWLKKYGIPAPTPWYTMKKGPMVLPDAETLRRMHVEESLTLEEVGNAYNVSPQTMSRLCKKYGILAMPSGARTFSYKADDGHFVRSSYELRVDNWLSFHGVDHICEPPLPFGGRHRADFLAAGTYIEIWGILRDDKYETTKAWKKEQYASHGLRLVELLPKNFRPQATERWDDTLADIFV